MKILHTADWHLGDRLGRIDRTLDLRAAVESVAALCKQEQVDVLLVAGDLFSEMARPDSLRETIQHWQTVFRPFLEGGGTILALTGNHDNEGFCQTLVHAMNLAAPTVGGMGETVPPGRLYLAAEPTLLRLQDPAGGHEVQFVLMPYPTPGRYLRGRTGLKYGSPEEKIALLINAWADALREIREHPRFDARLPSVLSAHIHLRGSSVGPSLFRISPEEDVVVEGAELSSQFDYVALGHIHKPHAVGGVPHVRYSGSIERMDLGEQGDQKGVVVVEIGPTGLVGEPVVLPLSATPIREIAVLNPAMDLPRLKIEYPDAATDLINLHVRYTAGTDQLEDVLRELDRLFPRWYAREWQESGTLGPTLVGEEAGARNFAETVRTYLEQELIQHDEADRAAILAIANELLKDLEG